MGIRFQIRYIHLCYKWEKPLGALKFQREPFCQGSQDQQTVTTATVTININIKINNNNSITIINNTNDNTYIILIIIIIILIKYKYTNCSKPELKLIEACHIH